MAVHRATAAMCEEFWRQGFLRIPHALSAAECDAIIELVHERARLVGWSHGSATEFAVWRIDRRFAEVVDHPSVIGIAVDIMGEDIQLMSAQYVVRNPGVSQQFWHTDGPMTTTWGYGYPPVVPPQSLLQLKVAYALHDLDARSGVTRVVPGSHLLPTSGAFDANGSPAQPEGAVPLEMAKGDAVLLHQSLWHSPADVENDQPRLMLFYAYNHVWAYPFDYRSVTDEEYERLTPVQRRLVRPFPDSADAIGLGYEAPSPSLTQLLEMRS